MIIEIKLTTVGVDSDFFDISSSSDGVTFGPSIVTNVSRLALMAGYTLSGVPTDAVKVRLRSNTRNCFNHIDLLISNFPTPTLTSTPQPTATPGVTATPTPTLLVTPTPTPTIAPYWYLLVKCSTSGTNFYAGSFTSYPQFPINERILDTVSGLYYTVYNITYNSSDIAFKTQVTNISDTGFSGCPGVTPTPTPTITATPTVTPSSPPTGYLYYKFSKCDGSYCYMSESTFNSYAPTFFQTGFRYYGAIEGDPNYLYVYTGQVEILYTLSPSCLLTGVTSTNDVCP